MVTKKIIGDQLLAYLQHRLTLDALTDWAEDTLLNGNYEDDAQHTSRNALTQLGLSDVKAFGLEWKDCESIMKSLGYKLEVWASDIA